MIRLIQIDGGRRFDSISKEAIWPAVESTAAFRRQLRSQPDPLVVLWHYEEAEVLPILRDLAGASGWPAQLAGIVLFKGAPFAGFGRREAAEQALDKFRTCLAPGRVKNAGVSGETCERTANIAPPASADQPKSGVSEP